MKVIDYVALKEERFAILTDNLLEFLVEFESRFPHKAFAAKTNIWGYKVNYQLRNASDYLAFRDALEHFK